VSLDLSVANVNIASDKAKSTIGFIANNVNMFVSTEVTGDIYAQVFDMVHMLKLVAMYIVLMESWVFLPCYRNNLALVWMELH